MCEFLSHRTVVWGYLVYCVFYLFVYGYGFLSGGNCKEIGAWHFVCAFDYYPDIKSPLLVNVGSRGVTAVALLPVWVAQPDPVCRSMACAFGIGAAALLKAARWDLRLASLLTHFLWPPYVIGQAIIFLPCGFYLSSFFLLLSSFFPHLISAAADWMSTILRHLVWP